MSDHLELLIVLNSDTVICDDCYEPEFIEIDPGLVPFGRTVHGECKRCRKRHESMTDEEMNEQTGGTLQPEENVLTILGGVRTGVWDRDEHGWRRRGD